ncbi:hypothetical protein BC833DRAFT_530464 [Globomyces pollinis-pini]|nr:hypothetical protein BC833DRAFT_530464 [Globomyces pollinis-pini]KAJ2999329.1 hypothetical protein HDV02_003110 [Globomyces sp. JEL0801]
MGRRSNPLAVRIKGLLNWPSNVSHPFLADYVKHMFQSTLVAAPHIRASTSGIWINVTLLKSDDILSHPKLSPLNQKLDFTKSDLKSVPGRLEKRTRMLAKHQDFKPMFKQIDSKTLIAACLQNGANNEALQIYRNTDIYLKINMISNPLLNADIMSQYIAHALSKRVNPQVLYRNILQSLSN